VRKTRILRKDEEEKKEIESCLFSAFHLNEKQEIKSLNTRIWQKKRNR